MKLQVFFAAALVTVSALTDKEQWVAFKQTHGKTYKSLLEEKTRYEIFEDNLRKIEEHNAKYDNGEETYFLGVTRFADMTNEEFMDMFTLQEKSIPALNATYHVFPEGLEIPDSIDWVEKGAVLGVKNQGLCGSCWVFSATGALEGQNAIKHNVKIPLSEQQMLDCGISYAFGSCRGGQSISVFRYARDEGMMPESVYPYQAKEGTCKYDSNQTILKTQGEGFGLVGRNEDELKKAVGTIGPISIAVNTKPLKLYSGGIISGVSCGAGTGHAVLAVGYGESAGMKYWKVKNSYGPSWGEQGYFRMERDTNDACGLASFPTYPVVN